MSLKNAGIFIKVRQTNKHVSKISALKLAKECNEAIFNLIDEGPSIMYLKQLQERLLQIENRQIR